MHKLEVKTIGHDWKVLEKKIVNKINYYLLQDCSPKEIESKGKMIPNPIHVDIPLFLVVKESKGVEHFSGRIVHYEDVNKKIKVKKEKAIPHGGIKYFDEDVPYVHKLWDWAIASIMEGQDFFNAYFEPEGLELVSVRLVSGKGDTEVAETILTTKEIETKQEKLKSVKSK